MAKERADKPRKERKEKAEKAEKKVSKDKVKKHEKEKKAKREASSDDSDNEPSKLEESPEAVEEPVAEPSATAPASELNPEKEEKRANKKDKSKKAAVEAAIEEGASNEATELPVRPASKDGDSDAEVPLFTIDTQPTKVDLEAVAEKGDAMDEDKDENTQSQREEHQKSGYNPPPSGLNRQARRRIRMIEERREKIQKDLGIPIGSCERADEVQAKLDAWVADFDGKAAIRMEKKKRRKAKEAARLKSKSGKVLTGRRLKERQKQLTKMKKANKKKGLAAVNTEA
ncbi:hypothetical protein F5Y06DRAFT_245973 [Hypoxylon sp. FL0890]|nr:hypothetical protein F5Y06DRAFT_245973 [Hypoxylon sp. FL0890]